MRGFAYLIAGILLGFAVLGLMLPIDRTLVVFAAAAVSIALLPIYLTQAKRCSGGTKS